MYQDSYVTVKVRTYGQASPRSTPCPFRIGVRLVFAAEAVVTDMTTTHMLETAGAEIAYDVRGPLPTADGRPPLLMIG